MRLKFLIFSISLIVLQSVCFSQTDQRSRCERARCHGQKYFDDSVHVFQTCYPNPFSPPTVGDTGIGVTFSGTSFYCDLADTVVVELLNADDSVVYREIVISRHPPGFSLYRGWAGPKVDVRSLRANRFKCDSVGKYRWVLVVNGRRKFMFGSFTSDRKGWYIWIEKWA
jgi:hypothetical protein